MSDASLQIRLLGPLEVERNGRGLALPPSRKARALLGYLAATGRPHGRAHLCDLLWEGPADPRAALRGALSKLRPLLDDGTQARIISRDGRAGFEPGGAMVDLAIVRVAAASPDADTTALADAAARFRGDFLEGLNLPHCYRFDTWCATEREKVRRLRASILSSLTARLSNLPEEALRYARDRVLLDPCAEAAHLEVIRLLAELGRIAEALNQYDTCRRILNSELGARPSRELEALRRAILPTPDSRPPIAGITPAPRQPGLIGRRSERDTINRMVSAAGRGDGEPVLLLTGEPGIGKTRLLDELGCLAREAGGEVLSGRAFEAEMIRPYGAWINALRAIPAEEVPMAQRPELAPLLPEFGPAPSESADRNRIFEAIHLLLVTRAATCRPLVVLLDDLQWIDESSAALLHFIARGVPSPGLLLACASRRIELEANPAAAGLLRALRREGRICELELDPLEAGDIAQLVNSMEPALDAELVFARSGGNPLFALEIARAGPDNESALPGTLGNLIEERLTRLDPAARGMLPWAAALGHEFDLDTFARLVELSSADLLLAVEHLERHGVLQPRGTEYDFMHDMVREVAYGQISEPRRRLIHGRIARVLVEKDRGNHELAGEVAHHASLGGDHDLAARSFLAAAQRALWACAPREASELVARGIGHLEGLTPETRLALHLELIGLSVYPGMKEHRLPDIEGHLSRIVSEARAEGLQAQVHRGFQLIADIHFLNGDFSGALDQSLRAQEAGQSADPATVVRAIGDTARCLGVIEQDMPRAERLAREAGELARGIGYEGHELPQALGYVHHHAGELDEAVACFERAACLARNEHERWFECACLRRLVMIELERGRATDALARSAELMEVAGKLGEGSDAPFAEALDALAHLYLGAKDAAARLDRAVAALRKVDSRWMIAWVQNLAGGIALAANRTDAARRRVEEALEAAEVVDRRNEVAVARSLLARLALQAGNRNEAELHLDALKEDLSRTGSLSTRARASVDAAEGALGTSSYGG